MKNIKEQIGYFGKMILVFPEAFLAKLTKPKSRKMFNNIARSITGILFLFFSLLLLILFFVNLVANFDRNNVGFFQIAFFLVIKSSFFAYFCS